MNRFPLLISLLVYMLSCTGNEAGRMSKTSLSDVLTSNHKSARSSYMEANRAFNDFMAEMARENMIASGDKDLHQLARSYFPDSTVIEGFDLHAREIGGFDTFRLVFYEYFDLYSPKSESYLGIFDSGGKAHDIHKLKKVSFEGNVNINIIDEQLLEISYYDFFEKKQFGKNGLLPVEGFYLNDLKGKEGIAEGYIYEYYRIDSLGQILSISDETFASLDRKYPQSSARILSFSELEGFSYDMIQRMKNEIFAQHGYIFFNKVIQKQFEKESWYKPRRMNIEGMLSEIEKINLAKLQQLEKRFN